MLVLTLSPDQSVTIGQDITVRIISKKSNKIRVGFDAPKDVQILRDNAKDTTDFHKTQAKDGTSFDEEAAND